MKLARLHSEFASVQVKAGYKKSALANLEKEKLYLTEILDPEHPTLFATQEKIELQKQKISLESRIKEE